MGVKLDPLKSSTKAALGNAKFLGPTRLLWWRILTDLFENNSFGRYEFMLKAT
jgi:hypothetical protein